MKASLAKPPAPAVAHARICTSPSLSRTAAIDSSRQRHPFLFARNGTHALSGPLSLGVLNALPARRDEVPPDVAVAIERCAADHNKACALGGRHARADSGCEHCQISGLDGEFVNDEPLAHAIDRAFQFARLQFESPIGWSVHVQIERFYERGNRRALAVRLAD